MIIAIVIPMWEHLWGWTRWLGGGGYVFIDSYWAVTWTWCKSGRKRGWCTADSGSDPACGFPLQPWQIRQGYQSPLRKPLGSACWSFSKDTISVRSLLWIVSEESSEEVIQWDQWFTRWLEAEMPIHWGLGLCISGHTPASLLLFG